MSVDREKAQEIEDADPDAKKSAEGIEVSIERMTEGLFYYKFKYQIFPDVRIVYAPPKSIGFFGGDTDNFQWPRHCGDFTFMRVYSAPDGKPAAYSTSNVPFRPKKHMTFRWESRTRIRVRDGLTGGQALCGVIGHYNLNLPFRYGRQLSTQFPSCRYPSMTRQRGFRGKAHLRPEQFAINGRVDSGHARNISSNAT